MFGIGMQELMIILLVALVVIGPKKLPEVAKSIAKGVRELRRASDDLRSTIMVDVDDEPFKAPRYQPPRHQPPKELPPRASSEEAAAGAAHDDDEGDDDGSVPPGITGSVAAAAGTVSRDEALADEPPPEPEGPEGPSAEEPAPAAAGPDPMDADDHSGMPYAPGSPELDELLDKARARQERDRASRTSGDGSEPV